MKVSLPLRLFLVQLIFTLGAGVVAVLIVRRSFERYNEQWKQEVSIHLATELYRPWANEIGRSLLLARESEFPEVREQRQSSIASGLQGVLKGLPSIRSVLIVDEDMRIQYASDASVADLRYTHPDDRAFLASASMQVRSKTDSGERVEEVVIPIYDDRGATTGPEASRRLGSILVRFVTDPRLVARVTERKSPSVDIEPTQFALPVVLFLGLAAAGGIAVAALTGLPVQRLSRALDELRARNFRGRLDAAELGLDGKLASAVQAINELGGRFEALDARGREREALLEKLSQTLEEGMLALRPDEAPVAWNRAALRIFSCPPPTVPTPSPQERLAAEEAALRRALDGNPEILASIRSHAEGGTSEVEVKRMDGTRISARITQVPFEVRPGEAGTLLLIRDLATLRDIEAHLSDAGRFAVLAHLAAGLAHEIRNPLHSIGLNATVVEQYLSAERTPERVGAMGESLASIREETQRLAELLNSYLGLVRPDTGAGPVDLREVCRRVMQLLAFPARKSNVDVRLESEGDLPPVHGVADRLQQAILNLVLNAIQAMPGGGVVSVRTSTSDGIVRVTVSDTGPGVPEDLVEHLFHTRVTTKPGGTGLGLPLVRMIVEAHGGSVWVRSKAGEGAVFTLILPSNSPV